MLARLPNIIDPVLLAERSATIAGEINLSDFERLAEFLYENNGSVHVNLAFRKDGKHAFIDGNIVGKLRIVCQRCLEALEFPLDKQFSLIIIATEGKAMNLPDGYDPLILPEDGKIQLKLIIEDEILLILPDIPKHQEKCSITGFSEVKTISSDNVKKDNPFSILADLYKREI
jgi:uncharacterized protein